EMHMRGVIRPNDAAFIKSAGSQLFWLHFLVRTAWRRHNPDVLRMLRVGITFIIFAIDRARDHADVALVFPFGLRFFCGRITCALRYWRCLIRTSPGRTR